MDQIEPGLVIDDYAMQLAQAIYRAGMEDMRDRAAKSMDYIPIRIGNDCVSRIEAINKIRALEI